MKEETKVEFKMPFFEENELEFIDNNIHELAHEFTKQFLKEKDLLIAQRIVKNLEQELQRKDNIINELKEELEFELQFQKGGCYNRIKNLLDKIKELENGN